MNYKLRMIHRSVCFREILFLGLVIIPGTIISQINPNAEWVIKEILKDSSFEGQVISRWNLEPGFIYWPKGLHRNLLPDPGIYIQLFKKGNKIITPILGTGMLYELALDSKKPTQLTATRIDSTIYFGYNFGAVNFIHQDTIFSLGGYGNWTFYGHLRFFQKNNRGWELAAVNRSIPIQYFPNGNYYDQEQSKLYATNGWHPDFGVKGTLFTPKKRLLNQTDTIELFKLDITSKTWTTEGILTKTYKEYIFRESIVHDLPFGKLFIGHPHNSYQSGLADFRNNKIWYLKNKELGAELWRILLTNNKQNSRKHIFAYYNNDTLTILTSQEDKFKFKITIEDFRPTDQKIWDEIEQPIWLETIAYDYGFFIGGLIFFLSGISMMVIYRKKFSQEADHNFSLDSTELLLIHGFLNKADQTLKTEELDTLLGKEGRSLDAQKKRRSAIIRSINSKYTALTEDRTELIKTERNEFDRRMFNYILSSKNYEKLKKHVPKTNGNGNGR